MKAVSVKSESTPGASRLAHRGSRRRSILGDRLGRGAHQTLHIDGISATRGILEQLLQLRAVLIVHRIHQRRIGRTRAAAHCVSHAARATATFIARTRERERVAALAAPQQRHHLGIEVVGFARVEDVSRALRRHTTGHSRHAPLRSR